MMTNIAYKYLNADGTPYNGGAGTWHLPKGGRPGRWMPKILNLVPCKSGYHGCREQDLLSWYGPTLWLMEYREPFVIHEDNKIVASQARLISQFTTWNERTQRLFAADCAEHVAHLYNRSTGWQPADTIEVARRYANGLASEAELAAAWEAAWAAAQAAVGAAARNAASTTERQWQIARLMEYLGN